MDLVGGLHVCSLPRALEIGPVRPNANATRKITLFEFLLHRSGRRKVLGVPKNPEPSGETKRVDKGKE